MRKPSTSQPLTVKRPTCGAPIEWKNNSKYRPFCSDCCKLIDLGAWAVEKHTILGDTLEDDTFSTNLSSREH